MTDGTVNPAGETLEMHPSLKADRKTCLPSALYPCLLPTLRSLQNAQHSQCASLICKWQGQPRDIHLHVKVPRLEIAGVFHLLVCSFSQTG